MTKMNNKLSAIERRLRGIPQKRKKAIEFDMTVSASLHRLMEKNKWEVDEVASRAEVTAELVEKWLSGLHSFTSNDIGAIAAAFNVKFINLLSVNIHTDSYTSDYLSISEEVSSLIGKRELHSYRKVENATREYHFTLSVGALDHN